MSKGVLVIQSAGVTPSIIILVTNYTMYCNVLYLLKTTELSKRKRSESSTDTELSPSSAQLSKRMAT